MKKVVKEYRVELCALAVFAVGLFLLVERWEIRKTLKSFLGNTFVTLKDSTNSFIDAIVAYFKNFSLSDLTGWVLIILTLVFIFWRLRVRFLKSDRWIGTTCPNCGGPLHRVHRTRLDKFFGAILLPDARRYRCETPDCHWTGLRHSIHHEHHHSHEDEDQAAWSES